MLSAILWDNVSALMDSTTREINAFLKETAKMAIFGMERIAHVRVEW